MDGLEVFRLDAIPGNGGVGFAAQGDIADEILDKNRIGIRPLGDVFFIHTLEQAEKFAAGGILDQADQILDPDKLPEADGQRHLPALIVRARLADGLGTGAQRGDRNTHTHDEIHVLAIPGGGKTRGVVEQTASTRNRSRLFQEKRKLEVKVGGSGMEALLEFLQHLRQILHVQDRAVGVEHFDEAAHVGAFVVVWQIHRHLHRGDGALDDMVFVADLDGIAQIFHADAVDGQSAVVGLALCVVQPG